jgi:hypothetical protein
MMIKPLVLIFLGMALTCFGLGVAFDHSISINFQAKHPSEMIYGRFGYREQTAPIPVR